MNYFSRYEAIREEAIRLSGNKDILLIAVSKRQSYGTFRDAYLSGICEFGENSIQEGLGKIHSFQEEYPREHQDIPRITIHHIGPLQTGSLRKLFGAFDYTHGVGSERSLSELHKRAGKESAKLGYFLQANLTSEQTKNGFNEEDLIHLLGKIADYTTENLTFSGLMTMGPTDGDPTRTREVFKRLRNIRDEFCPNQKLSMGMSGDYQIALEEGSDMIRIGTAIFGERNYG